MFVRQLDEAIEQYSRDRNRHKRGALWLKLSTSALGAVVTVLLGWQDPGGYAVALKNGALILSAFITLVAAYDAFFEPRKLWVRETLVLNSLRDVKREWEIVAATKDIGVSDVAAYSGRFLEILKRSLAEWVDGKKGT
jgi:predicted membrane chloride channel (bestrophin family)